ncbi:hypothetical protein M087_4218 [Bacteroides fragilis str. S23 R14]|nr:hypothetical protein M087_4218 [Bacteroides fragilis str. S23 R14]
MCPCQLDIIQFQNLRYLVEFEGKACEPAFHHDAAPLYRVEVVTQERAETHAFEHRVKGEFQNVGIFQPGNTRNGDRLAVCRLVLLVNAFSIRAVIPECSQNYFKVGGCRILMHPAFFEVHR